MHELRAAAFTTADFVDLGRLVMRLQKAEDRAAAQLFAMLSAETRREIAAYRPPGMPQRSLRERLADDLNATLENPALTADPAFGEPVPAGPMPGAARVRINRARLHAAFPGEFEPPTPRKPLHVVNIALNLVSGHNLAWQQRKAETFTVTGWHAGSYHLGYRNSRRYGGHRPGQQGISLGTAVAISGAAASPNMGYHSSPLLAFLMTFFNARLGWWLGNPGVSGARTFTKPFPMPSIQPIVEEAFALTDDTRPYVYLSDGGHFENLGLLEMILRRCHLIILSDAGCDPTGTFEDLGNAIRKVRTDLGIPITIERELAIYSRDKSTDVAGRYCAIATIDYPSVDGPGAPQGRLVYLKPAVYGRREPTDVFNYAQQSPTFPHESTADQFFTESQFESYRMLGFHTIREVWTGPWPPDGTDVHEFVRRAVVSAGADGRGELAPQPVAPPH